METNIQLKERISTLESKTAKLEDDLVTLKMITNNDRQRINCIDHQFTKIESFKKLKASYKKLIYELAIRK